MTFKEASCNKVLGGHTLPTREEKESAEPPLKRVKSEPASDSEGDLDAWRDAVDVPQRATDVESCLAPVRTDQESIEEYESSQVSQQETPGSEAANRLDQRNWAPGRSSIYVDAFNLALETVLDEESHLFNESERALFGFWNGLGYEAQYL
jgi:Fanconi-associated nuclease 1